MFVGIIFVGNFLVKQTVLVQDGLASALNSLQPHVPSPPLGLTLCVLVLAVCSGKASGDQDPVLRDPHGPQDLPRRPRLHSLHQQQRPVDSPRQDGGGKETHLLPQRSESSESSS